MGIQRRQHTPAFKKQVVLELLKGEKTRNEITPGDVLNFVGTMLPSPIGIGGIGF